MKTSWNTLSASFSHSNESEDDESYEVGKFFRTMWLICAFDLPTDTKEARRNYTHYRKTLLAQGFEHLQHSVYCRHFPNYDQARASAKRLGPETPSDGKVDFLFLTDKQLGLTVSYLGKKTREESLFIAPQQGMLF